MTLKLLKNCCVYTMDERMPYAEEVLIEDDKIVCLGNNERPISQKQLADNSFEEIDLNGKVILPGFNDSHLHLLKYGMDMSAVDLSEITNEQELITKVANYIDHYNISPGQWVVCKGLDEHNLQEQRFPTKELLDQISNQHPILVNRVCSHLCAVNSLGLTAANIGSDNIKRVEGGEVYLTEQGQPKGVFAEKAQELVKEAVPAPTETDIKNYIKSAAEVFASKGLTSVQTDDLTAINHGRDKIIQAYLDLAENGELPLKVNLQLQLTTPEEIDEFVAKYSGFWNQNFGGTLSFGPLKILLDGSLGGATAALREPYQGTNADRGIMAYSEEQLDNLVDNAVEHGMQVACHAIGDRAIENILDAIYKAQNKHGSDLSHRLVHCQLTDIDLIDRIAEQNLCVDVQPAFVSSDYGIVSNKIGHSRSLNTYAWKTMMDRGIVVSGSSDCPVEDFDPLDGIRAAITRQDSDGKPDRGWHPWEKLSIFEALKLYTTNSAKATYEEDGKGKLAPGYYADLVVMSQDLYAVDPIEYPSINIDKVMVNGEFN